MSIFFLLIIVNALWVLNLCVAITSKEYQQATEP